MIRLSQKQWQNVLASNLDIEEKVASKCENNDQMVGEEESNKNKCEETKVLYRGALLSQFVILFE